MGSLILSLLALGRNCGGLGGITTNTTGSWRKPLVLSSVANAVEEVPPVLQKRGKTHLDSLSGEQLTGKTA